MRTKIILACTECKQRNYFTTKEKKNSGLQDFFKGLKTEYNKIIFPTRQDIIKETTATIVVSLLVGALIAVLDLIMKTGLGFIIR